MACDSGSHVDGWSAFGSDGCRPLSVMLPALLDSAQAAPLRRFLLEHRGRALVLNGSCVERIEVPCLQVLLAARLTWCEDRIAFAIATPSAALKEDLAAYVATGLLHPSMEGNA